MRQMLRNFLAWADKRWPETVVVTQAAYRDLLAKVIAGEHADKEIVKRLEAVERDMNNLKFQTGLGPKLDAKVFTR